MTSMIASTPSQNNDYPPAFREDTISCPACASTTIHSLGHFAAKLDPGFHADIHRCGSCDTVFTWPVDPAVLEKFYAAAFEGGVGQILRESGDAKLKMAQVLYSEIELLLSKGGNTLDIGAGLGEWLEVLHEANKFDTYCGSEFSESMLQDLKARCPWAELSLSSAEEMGPAFKGKKFRLITLIAVIEHLYDPQAVLMYIGDNLEIGGKAVIVYPRIDSWLSRLLGKHWHLFSPVAHLTLYSERGLAAALEQAGLKVIVSRPLRHYYDLPYVFSFMRYFFPWTKAVVSRLAKVRWLQGIAFRLYTGIDVVVAERTK